MSDDRGEQIAAAVTGRAPSSKGWIRANCPFCEFRTGKADRKASFGFNVVKLYYECYRCGAGGRLKKPLDEYDGLELPDVDQAPQGVDGPPDGFLPISDEPARSALSYEAAWDYLLGPTSAGCRGLTEVQVARAGIGVTPRGLFQGRVVVPVLDPDGAWAWYVGRSWVKHAEKPYLYPKGGRAGLLYNHGSIFVKTDAPLLLVEGCFDAIPFMGPTPQDLDACAFLGKPTDVHMTALEDATRPTVFVLDGDAFDEAWALMMKLRLAGKENVGSIRLPPRVDPDEVVDAVLAAIPFALREGEVSI